jgi:hypothetical protein
MLRGTNPAILMAAAGILAASTALAEDSGGEGFFWPPKVEVEWLAELRKDSSFDSDDEGAEFTHLAPSTELDLNVFFARPLYLNAHFTLEPTGDPGPGMNGWSCEDGVLIENLSLNWERERWFLTAGKFGPNFAIAWDAAPGIYGTDTGEDDIELAGRIGLGGGLTIVEKEALGTHVLSGSVFFADTSALSQSLGARRGRRRLSDGGPSNTESLESFAVALDGAEIRALPGFRYHIGGVRQAVDRVNDEDDNALPRDEIDDEYRFAAAGEWAIKLNRNLTVTPLLEYVRFWNAEGIRGEDRDYLTASGLVTYGPLNLAVSYTGKFVDNPDGTDRTDYAFQLSGGYAFDFGLSADVGYKYERAEGTDSQLVGVLLVYEFDFNL